MKRSHGSMQRKLRYDRDASNTLLFALAALIAFAKITERLKWKYGTLGRSDSLGW